MGQGKPEREPHCHRLVSPRIPKTPAWRAARTPSGEMEGTETAASNLVVASPDNQEADVKPNPLSRKRKSSDDRTNGQQRAKISRQKLAFADGCSCSHSVSLPANYNDKTPQFRATEFDYPSKPPKTYPFELDSFQVESIKCLERREHVLVAAHTSAGKTAIAEYAVAMALKQGERIIYTGGCKQCCVKKKNLYVCETLCVREVSCVAASSFRQCSLSGCTLTLSDSNILGSCFFFLFSHVHIRTS